jgi:hypothetical protein
MSALAGQPVADASGEVATTPPQPIRAVAIAMTWRNGRWLRMTRKEVVDFTVSSAEQGSFHAHGA